MDALITSPPRFTDTHTLLCVDEVLEHISSIFFARGAEAVDVGPTPLLEHVIASLSILRERPYLYLPHPHDPRPTDVGNDDTSAPQSDGDGAAPTPVAATTAALPAWEALLDVVRSPEDGSSRKAAIYWAKWDAKKSRYFFVNLADPCIKKWSLGGATTKGKATMDSANASINQWTDSSPVGVAAASSTTTFPSATMSPTIITPALGFPQPLPVPSVARTAVVDDVGAAVAACLVAEATQRLCIAVDAWVCRLQLLAASCQDVRLRLGHMIRQCVAAEAQARQEVRFEAALDVALLMDNAIQDRRVHVASAEARRVRLEELALLLEASQHLEQTERIDIAHTEAGRFVALKQRIHAALSLHACPAVRDIAEHLVSIKADCCDLHLEQAAVYQDAIRSIMWGRPCVRFDGQAAISLGAMRGSGAALMDEASWRQAQGDSSAAMRKEQWRHEGRLLSAAYAAMEEQRLTIARLMSPQPPPTPTNLSNVPLTPTSRQLVLPDATPSASVGTAPLSAVVSGGSDKKQQVVAHHRGATGGHVMTMVDATELLSKPTPRRNSDRTTTPRSRHHRHSRHHQGHAVHGPEEETETLAPNYYWSALLPSFGQGTHSGAGGSSSDGDGQRPSVPTTGTPPSSTSGTVAKDRCDSVLARDHRSTATNGVEERSRGQGAGCGDGPCRQTEAALNDAATLISVSEATIAARNGPFSQVACSTTDKLDACDATSSASGAPSWYPSSTTLLSPAMGDVASSRSASLLSGVGGSGGPQPSAAPAPVPLPRGGRLDEPRSRWPTDLMVPCDNGEDVPPSAMLRPAVLPTTTSPPPHSSGKRPLVGPSDAVPHWDFPRSVGVLLSADHSSATCRLRRPSQGLDAFALSERLGVLRCDAAVRRVSVCLGGAPLVCSGSVGGGDSGAAGHVDASEPLRVFLFFTTAVAKHTDLSAGMDGAEGLNPSPPRSASALLQAVAANAAQSELVYAAVLCEIVHRRQSSPPVATDAKQRTVGRGPSPLTTDVSIQSISLADDHRVADGMPGGLHADTLSPDAFAELCTGTNTKGLALGPAYATANVRRYDDVVRLTAASRAVLRNRATDAGGCGAGEGSKSVHVSLEWTMRQHMDAAVDTRRPAVDVRLVVSFPCGTVLPPYTTTIPLPNDMHTDNGRHHRTDVAAQRIGVQFNASFTAADLCSG